VSRYYSLDLPLKGVGNELAMLMGFMPSFALRIFQLEVDDVLVDQSSGKVRRQGGHPAVKTDRTAH
jgi:hypothetical protein